MIIHIPAFEAMARCNEHLNHGPIDVNLGPDVVMVVRCKDCKWYNPDTDCGIDEATGKRDHSKIVRKPYGECQGQNFHFTEDGFLRVGDDDFCSYGEREEGAD